MLTTAVSPLVTSCNSDVEYEYTLPSSALVRSFSLSSNSDVLPNLDSVYFSIDLYNLEIYNADSLPYGTQIDRLVPVILTDGAQLVELSVPRTNATDTIYNYTESTTDSIDFSNGPVKLRVVSLNGNTERTYTVRVNVHQIPTDTMVWSRLDKGNLPTLLPAVNSQHTAQSPDGRIYCLTRYQSDYSLAVADDPGSEWTATSPAIAFDADIHSFTATNDALYLRSTAGNLFRSTDNGATWTDTGEKVADILGAYSNHLLASCDVNGTWCVLEYPVGKYHSVTADFPVRNSSTALTLSYAMQFTPQLVLVGGRRADGELTNTTWGFDGTKWANLTKRAVPEKLENLAVVPYFNVQPDSISWGVDKKTTVLLAMCGNRADGTPNDTVYMSYDFGMHWDKAPQNMQIPTSVVPSRTQAQAYPYTGTTYAAKKSSRRGTPLFVQWVETGMTRTRRYAPASRVSSPVTEWQVPYIYLYGGENAEGIVYNTVFRGTFTSLTLKPVQ